MEFMGSYVNGVAELILGFVALFISVVLFLLPMPTIGRIWKEQNVGDAQAYPYIAAFVNSLFWYTFAQAKEEEAPFKYECLIYSGAVGFLIESIYIFTFTIFSVLKNTLKWYTGFAILTVCPLAFVIPVFPCTGFEIIVAGSFMYMSPMFLIVHSYKTNSVESLPFWQSIILGLHGLTWMIYARLPPTFDIHFAIVNAIGTIMSVLQLGFCYLLLLKFRKLTAVDFCDVDEKKPRTSDDGNGELEQLLLD